MRYATKLSIISLYVLIAQFSISNIYADTTLVFNQKINTNDLKESIIYIKDGKINFFEPGDNSKLDVNANQYSIFDSHSQKIVHINPSQKSYIEIDQQTIDQQMLTMKTQMDQMIVQMKKQMNGMPEDQRKIMQSMMSQDSNGMMGGNIPGMPTQQKKQHINTGKNETITNINCRVYDVIIDYARAEELCIANENKFNIDPADINTMVSLRLFIKQMSNKTTVIANKQELNSPDLVTTYEGVPIRTRHYDRAGNLTYEETLNSVSQEKISMDKILIPANYTQQKMQ